MKKVEDLVEELASAKDSPQAIMAEFDLDTNHTSKAIAASVLRSAAISQSKVGQTEGAKPE